MNLRTLWYYFGGLLLNIIFIWIAFSENTFMMNLFIGLSILVFVSQHMMWILLSQASETDFSITVIKKFSKITYPKSVMILGKVFDGALVITLIGKGHWILGPMWLWLYFIVSSIIREIVRVEAIKMSKRESEIKIVDAEVVNES